MSVAQIMTSVIVSHADEPIDHYFFMSYEVAQKKMWLLGGIDRETFLTLAKRYNAGDWVHPNYQIRPGHEIYNIEIAPRQWLALIHP